MGISLRAASWGCHARNGRMPSSSFGRAPPGLQFAGRGKETQGCVCLTAPLPCSCTGTHPWGSIMAATPAQILSKSGAAQVGEGREGCACSPGSGLGGGRTRFSCCVHSQLLLVKHFMGHSSNVCCGCCCWDSIVVTG